MNATIIERGMQQGVSYFDTSYGTSNLNAAHVVVVPESGSPQIVAVYGEPEDREPRWPHEEDFRQAIREHVQSWANDATSPGDTLVIQFDPGRNQCAEETVTF